MPRGVWTDTTPGKRSAAAKKAARSRVRRSRVLADRRALHAFLHEGGPPLPAPEQGISEDRVLRGDQIRGVIDGAIARLRERDAAMVEAAE
jgi:hypothetical protein